MSNARQESSRAPYSQSAANQTAANTGQSLNSPDQLTSSVKNLEIDIAKNQQRHAAELPAREVLEIALRAAVDQKSFDVRGLDVADCADFTDYFLIASGTSPRHAQGIADKIEAALRKAGQKPYACSGYDHGEWIVLDYGDFVAHIFYEPTRQFYEFDELWAIGKPIALDPQLALEARELSTGRKV